MKTPKPVAATVCTWLKNNLGPHALAPLTSNDHRALLAAVQIVDLYAYNPANCVLNAFGSVVSCMQPHTQRLAYHAIAHVMDWGHRPRIWAAAGLEEGNFGLCKYEPANRTALYAELQAKGQL
jgi:hypothetical protein